DKGVPLCGPIPAGIPCDQNPNTVWDGHGELTPAEYYQWTNQPHVQRDFRVEPILFTRAYDLLKAVEVSARSPKCTGSGNCNFFVGKTGEQLNVPYFKNVLHAKNPDRYLANNMFAFISNATKSGPSGWRKVPAYEVQGLANRGFFVVGVARNVRATGHGHIVIVVPASAERNDDQEAGTD